MAQMVSKRRSRRSSSAALIDVKHGWQNSPASPPKLAGHEFVISDFSTGRGYNLIDG
jgi:hypothetical protein